MSRCLLALALGAAMGLLAGWGLRRVFDFRDMVDRI